MDNIEVGTPVFHPAYETIGHVCNIEETNGNVSVITGNGLQQCNFEYVIVWEESKTITHVSDGIADDWFTNAAIRNLPKINSAPERLIEAQELRDKERAQQAIEQEKAKQARAEFIEVAKSKMPTWAKAVIVAELVEDQSDSMSDYWGSKTTKTIILAWSKHDRDLFPEMRKAAMNNENTILLATAPDNAEHREKYSMGGGYYLKDSYRHNSGWKVSKQSIVDYRTKEPSADRVPSGLWSIPEKQASAPIAKPGNVQGGFTVEEHTHTKHGFQMWIVVLADRVERDEYLSLLATAKESGGWYSRKWGKSPAGFAFKEQEQAQEFADSLGSTNPAPPQGPKPGQADKFRSLADKMQGDIDHKLGDRLTNTPKRQREAANARHEGDRLKRTQEALRAIADHIDAGTLPDVLARLNSKKAVYDLTGSHIDRTNAGYYDAGIDTGKPSNETPETLALWSMIQGKTEAEKQAEILRDKIESLQFSKIAGYFPTPGPVIDQMIEAASIPQDSSLNILEPSAGHGSILDAIKTYAPCSTFSAFEINYTLQNILELKGYNLAGDDFQEAETMEQFDRVLMNPPFEKGQDIDHVRKAFSMLAPGGRLVSIMSPGPFFRSDRKSQEFRVWFDSLGGEKIDLPENSFKQSGTGVSTVMIVIDGEF